MLLIDFQNIFKNVITTKICVVYYLVITFSRIKLNENDLSLKV